MPLVRPSQGVHIVLDRSFQPSDTAIMVPQTDDGRVLFVIPWYDRVLVGTTDTLIDEATLEPSPMEREVEFILRNAARYLRHDPSKKDVLSMFAGLRPLVQPQVAGTDSKSISREHSVVISEAGLVTIIGGKWTTYRKMAEDTVDDAIAVGGLPERPCVTEKLHLYGWVSRADPNPVTALHMQMYGAHADAVQVFLDEGAGRNELLHERLPYRVGQVAWAARREMARTVEDVLSRRTRALLLDARAAMEASTRVAEILAAELGRDETWQWQQIEAFNTLALGYLP